MCQDTIITYVYFQADEWLREVTPNAKKLEEHERKRERKREEKELREKKERIRKAQEAREAAAKAAQEEVSNAQQLHRANIGL